MYLKGCLQSNRCGAPRLDHRHPKPYIKLNLKGLAIEPFSWDGLLPHFTRLSLKRGTGNRGMGMGMGMGMGNGEWGIFKMGNL